MSDIYLNHNREIEIDSNSDFILISGNEMKLQNIKNRLMTPLKGLFFDTFFGCDLTSYLHSSANTDEIESIISIALKQEEEIDENSININITQSQNTIEINIEFEFISESGVQVLNLTTNKN